MSKRLKGVRFYCQNGTMKDGEGKDIPCTGGPADLHCIAYGKVCKYLTMSAKPKE